MNRFLIVTFAAVFSCGGQLGSAAATKLIATLPQGISGLLDPTLQTDHGRHTTRICVDAVATSHLAPRL